MKRKPETKPAPPKDRDANLTDLGTEVIANLLGDIGLNETRAGRVARLALRMKRDDLKLNDAERAEIKALVSAIGKGLDRAEKTGAFTPDDHGNDMFTFVLPPELQDEPTAA